MRNLIYLIWRNNFFIYFILLESLCFYFIVQYNNYQKASFVNSSSFVAGKTFETTSSISSYIGLQSKNRRLAIENAELRSRLINSYMNSEITRQSVIDSVLLQQYKYSEADVISNSTNKRNNFLTLNRGSKHGVKPEMGVITDQGVVGIVQGVSKNYCSVMSILHKDSRISARIKKNGYFGSLIWEGKNATIASLKEIPAHVPIQIGDSIVTSSYSAIFPQNITIGVIKSFEQMPSKDFYKIEVLLSVDFKNLSNVYLIDNLLRLEQEELESKNAE
ncbi:MAG: rod shape-determining protein MreC [Bacteroidia bacterium]|nr:rod shape-determining protein MreC [Bacteroidia bacterium]